MKNYLVTMEFCVGEQGQLFTMVFSGKTEKAMIKSMDKYFKDYYGEGELEDYEDGSGSYLYRNGVMVKNRGYEELTSLDQVIRKLGKD